ncbi:MAG: cytochrome c, partial [Rhodospirillales bacterium]|nr:cytochrome c [Rhodospirillales bacterium]
MKRLAVILIGVLAALPAAANDAPALYDVHCAACHGGDRLGAIGPALLPENLGRLKPARARQVVAQGRPASQMAGFAEVLTASQIAALVDLIYTPLPAIPNWGL